MNSFARLSIIACSIFFVAACAKTEAQKTQDARSSVQADIANAKSSLNELTTMGPPSATWSDAQLDRYDALLTSCETSLTRIEGANGKDRIEISDVNTIPQIRVMLSYLRSSNGAARLSKARGLGFEGQPAA